MSSWRKMLRRMAADTNPVGYSYADVTRVLKQLGFVRSGKDGSHRTWKLELRGSEAVRVPVVDKGKGKVNHWYVRNMIVQLRDCGLLQPYLDEESE